MYRNRYGAIDKGRESVYLFNIASLFRGTDGTSRGNLARHEVRGYNINDQAIVFDRPAVTDEQ